MQHIFDTSKKPALWLLSGFVFVSADLCAQDTTLQVDAPDVILLGVLNPNPYKDTDKEYILAGKKNELLNLSGASANLITNNSRQVFAKAAGLTVWESDGSGIQISVGARGLSPNRSWEFNTRQNGYDMSSDVFGYPEAYYNPPMEAVEKIQILRGAASLQFGAQFGGLLNYILKREHTPNKPFTFETQNAVGSYGLLSSYNAIGGNTQKWEYYAYNHSRKANGWRENGRYEVRNTHGFVKYKFSPKASLSAEYTNMGYVAQQSGGLTDAQFAANPRQSLRARNWFGTDWNLANLSLDIRPSERLSFNLKAFGLWGARNSVGFTARPNVLDTINASTRAYNPRQVDMDEYKNFGTELRGLYTYELFGKPQNLAFGLRGYQANTKRQQRGVGSTGADFNLDLGANKFPTVLDFTTNNFAVFAEQIFRPIQNLSIVPGIRYEYIQSHISGQLNISNGNPVVVVPQTLQRSVLLAGLGLEYKLNTSSFYANISQAYRPVLFSDLTPPATTDVIDTELKDASGFNADFGYRGALSKYFTFDVSGFYVQYNNRIGTLRKFINDDPTKGTYQFRTNLGATETKGVEAYLEFNISKLFLSSEKGCDGLSAYATLSFIDATYKDFKITSISGTAPNVLIKEDNLAGKKVEYAPNQIHSFGLTYRIKGFSLTAQARVSGGIYTDANNTETASADGVTGKLDGYQVFDLTAAYTFLEKYNLKIGINNLADTKYSTRRSGGYPGPGILPSEGRTFYVSIGGKF